MKQSFGRFSGLKTSFRILLSSAGFWFALSPLCTHAAIEAGSDVTTSSTLYDRISKKFALSYSGIYRGASISNIGNGLTPATDGIPDPDAPQSIENSILTGYKINENVTASLITHFIYYPSLTPQSNQHRFDMLDPEVRVAFGSLYQSGRFSLSGRLGARLPLSRDGFQSVNNLAFALTPVLNWSYQANSDLSLNLSTLIRVYVPTASSPADVRTYKIYIAPNMSYKLTKNLSFTLWIDLIDANRNRGTGFISGLKNGEVDIEPGLNWQVTENISINPSLNIYPGQLTLAATSFMAFINAKAF